MENSEETKFCKFCGAKIPKDAVLCTYCGRQVEEVQSRNHEAAAPQVVINNTNTNTNNNGNVSGVPGKKICNKWVSFFLCLFFGVFGAHKFYEGKKGMGFLYLFTLGLAGIGWGVDLIVILFKPNPYLA